MIPDPSRPTDVQGVLTSWVTRGEIVGGVVLVAERGQIIISDCAGWADREQNVPFQINTVLRYASMTKLVVSVIALRLCEQGHLALDAPVTDWLPWFRPCLADGTCAVIRIRHLLNHTSGLGYGFELAPNNPYARAGVSDGLDSAGIDLQENLERLMSVPLFAPPGTQWRYSLSTDVLGAVIEAACHDQLGRVAKAMLLEPLGMESSGFPGYGPTAVSPAYWPQGSRIRRLVGSGCYTVEQGRVYISEERALEKGLYDCAGAGMVGTAHDYMKLLLCLRAGGAPVLSLSGTKHLTTGAIGSVPVESRGPGWTFGFGPMVLADPALANHVQGRGTWGWCGVHGGHYWCDPEHDLALVALTNTGVTGAWGPFADQLVDVLYA